MIIKEETNKNLPITDINNYYVVADFDRTITECNSKTSWDILATSDLVPKEYISAREQLYNKYRPIEIDETIDYSTRSRLVCEWYLKHIKLFTKYQITEELFYKVISDIKSMNFRNSAIEFLEFLHKNNIPLIIISAGIGNFIELFLKNNGCYYDNVYVSSNTIIFKDGIASVDNIIHSFNKNETSLPDNIKEKIKNKRKVILLGDQLSDLNMVDESIHDIVIKVGFYSTIIGLELTKYEKYFDIVCEPKDDYYILRKKLLK